MKKSAAVRISYVDGLRLQYAVLAGCQEIILHERELNSINVFPIPDKDTGTNLKKTLLPILDTFPLSQTDIHIIIRKISELVSQSALGYSGIIFSQIFLGLSDGLKNLNTLRTKDLGPISQWMVKRAYQSVEHPAEGTILSVLKEWAKGISRLCTSTHDFVRLLQESYPPALSALQKTPCSWKL